MSAARAERTGADPLSAAVTGENWTLRAGPLVVRPAEYQVMCGGLRAGLTVREFQVFWTLAQRPDHVLTRQNVYGLVWGGAMGPNDRSVDVFVRKVRGKLLHVAPEWTFIHTHFGIGYRFCPERVGASRTSSR